ncbi:UbiA family prenyltransferase [Mesorhizobium sp. KR1-2]|uniref:UbiA family prenyltransferase n=1 Tax=Mesorhizobium sp. KR1-2 TaxID=3156609 RepID=UPI0032B48C55
MGDLPVLAVDLDKTLIRSDVIYESFWDCASTDIWKLLQVLGSLAAGKAQFKARLARNIAIDPASLVYNDNVVDYIKEWREQGGKAVLVTATDQSIAKATAHHLGLFDEVYGSDGMRNLKGSTKADFLVERYGAGNYDYIGDSHADLPVWSSARRAITVGLSQKERGRVHSLGGEVMHLSDAEHSIRPYLKAIRPHQWSKNILVFLPLIAAHEASIYGWLEAFFAFVCFSLVASSVYVLNDLLDLSADRVHPRKRSRPFASGAIPLQHGTFMVPGLLLTGLLFGLYVQRVEFLLIMALYYATTMVYSLCLKRKLIVDICALASLYSLRIFAGGAATGLPISEWLMAFSIFIFFSLAAVKRQGELVDIVKSGRGKAKGRGYVGDDQLIVSMMALSSGYIAVLVMALYLDSPAIRELYSHPTRLWGNCLVLLYWVSRMVMMAHRGIMDDDPIVFAVKDRVSRYCGILILIVIIAGIM